MNQSKFTLADVLIVLAVLSFGFICFLGVNFLNISNDRVWGISHSTGCVVIAVVIALLLFGTAYGAKLLKRTYRNFKTCFVWEVILLMLFVVFAVFFLTKASPFTHYFTVTEHKSEINSKLLSTISQAENMFAAYESYAVERERHYRNKLISVVAAKNINPNDYGAYGFQHGIADTIQINTKMFTVHAVLFPTNYSDSVPHNGIKEVATKWLQEAKSTTRSWKPIGIVGVVNDIEKNSNDWLNTLVALSQVQEMGEQASNFEYPLSFDDVKTHFTKFHSPTPLSAGLAIFVYLLMLLSWFVTKRSPRFPGLKFLFGMCESDSNVL